jgi:uncharacterized FlaG/YvyC family protein
MSINPVQAISQIVEERLANAKSRQQQPPAPVEVQTTDPNAGRPPKADAQEKQNPSASAELPQDEVRVQRDSQTNDDVVVKYMDHSGDLILQVPSSQVLGVARAIDQDFRAEAKARAVATEADDKGGKNGD